MNEYLQLYYWAVLNEYGEFVAMFVSHVEAVKYSKTVDFPKIQKVCLKGGCIENCE